MAVVDLSKVMNLADAQEIYKDLRDRIKDAGTVKDVKVDGVSVLDENGVAIIVLPTVPVSDVQVNGTSVLNDGVANIPVMGGSTPGVARFNNTEGIGLKSPCILKINEATSTMIKDGTYVSKPIVPGNQHYSAFFGLAKAAGADLKNSDVVPGGSYNAAAKQAIQKMLGFDGIFGDYQNGNTASKAYAVGETFIMDGKRYKVTSAISDGGLITVGTNCVLDPIDGRYVKNTDYATTSKAGLVTCSPTYSYGINIVNDTGASGDIRIKAASSDGIKSGTQNYQPIVPNKQHESVFFGLSKAAGVDLANETVTVGTYPATAKAAILAMLGAVGDGNYATTTSVGVVKVNPDFGTAMRSSPNENTIMVRRCPDEDIKAGADLYRPNVPYTQHLAAFFGLAKAAGADMASLSDVTVGQYPQAQKAAIQSMLGVSTGAILIENVSGGTPTLTCLPNVRYKCGEVSTLSITPPASGSCEVMFESGSTATLLTVPNTVKFPPWFDATALETGTIYDIIITDGVYGAVMTWES